MSTVTNLNSDFMTRVLRPKGSISAIAFKQIGKSVATFFRFPSLQADSELAKLVWLVRLRWMAITLFFLLAGPGLVFGLLNRTTFPMFIAVIGVLFLFNLLTQMIFVEPKKSVSQHFICFQLALDLLVLSGLLSITGGFTNPFVGLFLLNASLGGILISKKLGWPFLLLTHTLLGLLQIGHIEMNPASVDATLLGYMIVSHALVFSFWLVMRSLGSYLERQSETHAQARIHLEKQDRLRALGSLAAGFSHEFASPLNTTKLRLERLKRNGTSESSSEDITEALASIESCEQVIHQMNSSQLDARDFHLKAVKIKDLLTDVIESWKEEHPSAQLLIEILADEVVQVPPVNFAQVVLNLLDNSFEANPSKEITIRFELFENQYSLTVEDQGDGFPDSILERIGEPFVTTKVNGTGLGLYVSQLFSQSLGGDMILSNIAGSGARVSLCWPVAQAEGTRL